MFLKSVFQNKIFINVLFFAFLFMAFLSLFLTFFSKEDDINIPIFSRVNPKVGVNIETRGDVKIDFFMNNKKILPSKLHKNNPYILFKSYHEPIYSMYFKTDNIGLIDNIVINLGKNVYYYDTDKIKKFEREKNCYILPNDIKYYKNSKYVNDKGLAHKISFYILSVFYNTPFYNFSLVLFAICVLIYQLNKDKINIGFKIFKNSAIYRLLILAAIFRIQDNAYPLWGDELYTMIMAGNPEKPLSDLFMDPGNPPFYFLLARIWQIIFGNSEIALRMLPTLFSLAAIYMLYIFVKKNSNESLALFASFLLSINIYAIHSAQEFRCYSLCYLFTIISSYYLFEIIKYKKTKDFVIYGIVAILMANTHFFQILILAGEFVLGMILLDNKSRLKLFICNLAAAVCFLPYFLVTGLSKGLLDETFNHMAAIDLKTMLSLVWIFYSNKIVPVTLFIIALALIPKICRNKLPKEDKSVLYLYFYSIYTVLFLYLSSYVFSHTVKPIIISYYFVEVLPFMLLALASGIMLPFKNKIIKTLVVLILLLNGVFCITGRGVFADKNKVLVIRNEEVIKYSFFDSAKYKNKKIAIAQFDFIDYINYYKNFVRDDTEILVYKFIDTPETLYNKIINSKADVIYLMLRQARYQNFVEYFSPYADIAALLSDKGGIIVRMNKK